MNYEEIKKDLIHPWEKPMRVMNVIIFVLAVIGSLGYAVSLLISPEKMTEENIGSSLFIFTAIAAIIIQMGRQYGKSRAQSIQLTEAQFPEVYEIVKDFSKKLELGYVPEVYLTQEGGTLNAFATSFFSRRYISINSSIFEIAYLEHKDVNAVAFVIAHELTHLKRKHATTLMTILESVARAIPVWGSSQSRIKEYTCDRHAAWLVPEGKEGLILLAAGKHLYKHVNIEEYLETSSKYKGFFYWLHNLLASHPVGPKRIKALMEDTNRGEVF